MSGSWFPGMMNTGPLKAPKMSATFCTSTRSTPLCSKRSPATRMNSTPCLPAAATTRRPAARRSSRTRAAVSPRAVAFIPICQSAVWRNRIPVNPPPGWMSSISHETPNLNPLLA
jgi:hypothetical protein